MLALQSVQLTHLTPITNVKPLQSWWRYTLYLMRKSCLIIAVAIAYTSVYSHLYAHKAKAADYYGYGINCLEYFKDPPPSGWGSEGMKWCTAGRAMVSVALIMSGILGIGIGASILTAVLSSYVVSATVARDNSSLCSYTNHPLPYTDDLIRSILIDQGQKPNIHDIMDKYKKICVKYMDTSTWIEPGRCSTIKGITFCAYYPDWARDSQNIICADPASVCPCKATVGGGVDREPDYEKDSNGYVLTDELGNPSIIEEANYMKRFLRHCIMVNQMSDVPMLQSFKFAGIIDETCNNGLQGGLSKQDTPSFLNALTCFYFTMRNIIEKPILNNSTGNDVTKLSPEDIATIEDLKTDLNFCIKNTGKGITLAGDLRDNPNIALDTNPTYANFVLQHNSMLNGSAFLYNNKTLYNIENYLTDAVIANDSTNATNLANLNRYTKEQNSLCRNINIVLNNFTSAAIPQNVLDTMKSMFQSIKDAMKLPIFMSEILLMVFFGLKVIRGGQPLAPSVALGEAIKFATIGWFVMSDGVIILYDWSLTALNGATSMISSSFSVALGDYNECDYSKSWYPQSSGVCAYPNAAMNGSTKPFFIKVADQDGADIFGCVKGPYLKPIDLFNPSQAYTYNNIEADGSTTTTYMKMFCTQDNNPNATIEASATINPVTNIQIRFYCKNGFTLEPGYRVSEYTRLGINMSWATGLGASDPVPTAFYITDITGTVKPIFPTNNLTQNQLNEKYARYNYTTNLKHAIEIENQKHRYYPKVERYGRQWDLPMPDVVDGIACNIKKFTMKDSKNLFVADIDPLGIIVGGPFAVIIVIAMLVWIAKIFAMYINFVQTTAMMLVSYFIIVLTIPVIMPLYIIDYPQGILEQQFKKARGYLMLMLISVGIIYFNIVGLNYAYYGGTETWSSQSMFTANGEVNPNCWETRIWDAPVGCLIKKLISNQARKSFLGIKFKMLQNLEVMVACFFAICKTGVFIFILDKVSTRLLSSMKTIFGVEASFSIPGSIFNDPTGQGFNNAIKGAVGKLQQAASAAKKGKGKGSGGGGGGIKPGK